MVGGLKRLLGRGAGKGPAGLDAGAREIVESWRASTAPTLDDPHFLTRYVVVDVATTGQGDDATLAGIVGLGVRGGAILPADAFACDITAGDGDPLAVDRSLAAFLTYAAKAPLVTFHSPFVAGHLQKLYHDRLGVDFQPRWIDLAWLLPSLFPERAAKPVALDDWLEMLGIGAGRGGRRDTMSNALVLGRLFQMLLVRANDKDVLTAAQLIEESQAATRLRRTI
jgi:DNA polymerase-3 subunit epsilon